MSARGETFRLNGVTDSVPESLQTIRIQVLPHVLALTLIFHLAAV